MENKSLFLSPDKDSLLFSLQENFNHARHQEILRERVVFSYWAAWGAVLGFIYSQGGDFLNYPTLFALLSLITIPVLIGTLKWSFEFGNHVVALHRISLHLELNSIQSASNQINKLKKYLPFEEFQGFQALPLDTPFYLNIAFVLILLEIIGLGVSVFVFTLSVSQDINVSISVAVTIFSIFSLGSIHSYNKFKSSIERRKAVLENYIDTKNI